MQKSVKLRIRSAVHARAQWKGEKLATGVEILPPVSNIIKLYANIQLFLFTFNYMEVHKMSGWINRLDKFF